MAKERPYKRSDPVKIRIEKERALEEAERRQRVDSGIPKPVSPPAGRVVKTWRGRKPIIKGGAVIGVRKGNNTA